MQLRAFALRVEEQLTNVAFDKIGFIFPTAALPSWKVILTRAKFLSGIKPVLYDRCPNSCICYAGLYAGDRTCCFCKTPRFDESGHPAASFAYLPFTPRLKAFVANPTLAAQMQYRKQQHEKDNLGSVEDVFNSVHYRQLCQERVRVAGKDLPHCHFSDGRDVAMGFSTDGFCLYRRRGKKSAWPLLLFTYNLPPDVRFHLANVISLGIIPRKPKDIDSFLWPMVKEFLRLAIGITAYDALSDMSFRLHAYLILLFGDIPAVSMLMLMKGHNGLSPCRMCQIRGVAMPGETTSKTKYVPLFRCDEENSGQNVQLDPLDLPLRTHDDFMEQAEEVQSAPTATESKRLAREYGIKGVSILSQLSSISFPRSFPYDFMHLIWENLLPNLIKLWTGTFKGLDEGNEHYHLSPRAWTAIGKACSKAGPLIPAAYGPKPEDLSDPSVNMTADAWSFWALYLGPILLESRFKKRRYYDHFVDLVRLLNMCLQYEYTPDDIAKIKTGFASWVLQYKRYVCYHGYNIYIDICRQLLLPAQQSPAVYVCLNCSRAPAHR